MADFNRVLIETEDFLMRQLGSRAAREASLRKVRRGVGEVARRMRRAATIFGLLLLALLIWSVFVGGVGFLTWLAAVPILFLVAAISLLWPTRKGRAPAMEEDPRRPLPLGALAGRCEDWLLDRCGELPRPALPAAEAILVRLRDLEPHLDTLPPDSPAAGDARRLIGGHLPRLVDSYAALPPQAQHGENVDRVTESLAIVADELTRLCSEIDGCRASAFETQHRFIGTRYGESGF